MPVIEIKNVSEIDIPAKLILENKGDYKIFAFFGSMGAGKTTLIKAICKQLKVNENVASPTFSLINEYTNPEGEKIYHFDFYRINKIEEIFDFGYEEYFYSGCLCFIEWPEIIADLLPPRTKKIVIRVKSLNERTIHF